jgi:predicted DNA-binding transcriptional regulator AlpA
MTQIILRAPDVAKMTGLSVRSFRRLEAEGQFPAHVILTKRSIGYSRQAVEDWCERKLKGGETV